jgi:broad specificity phosphatase PhoE
MTQILLVRHGQTEWNRIERFRGHIDIPLNQVGLQQADLTANWIADRWAVSAIYSSPLSRAFQTAEAIAKEFSLKVNAYPNLIDLNFGAWQGKTPEDVQFVWPEIYTAWLANPQNVRIPDGETIDELRTRTRKAIQELVRNHPEETIVLVAHTDVNRSILLNARNWPTSRIWEIRQNNCAINILYASDSQLRVIAVNQTEHLLPVQQNREEV